jgi:putative inorganic carbon (hco3(-)) transporter
VSQARSATLIQTLIGESLRSRSERRDLVTLGFLVVLGLGLVLSPPFPLVALLLALAFAAAVASPPAAMGAVAASVPFVFHPVAVGDAKFSLLEIALVIGSIGLATRWVFIDRAQGINATWRVVIGDWRVSVVAVVLVVLGVLSLVTLADDRHRPESLRELRVVIVEPIAALVLMRWTVRHYGTRIVILGLAGAACAVSLVAIGQVITGRGEVIGDEVGRATGPYPHPNNLALYLDRLGLFVGVLAYVSRRYRTILVLAASIIVLGLAATLSRGALLAVVAGVALVIWLVRPARAWRWFAVTFGLLIALFAVVAGDRFFASGTGGDVSSRELIWRSSLQMISDHPVFGVGLDQFLYQYAPRYVTPAGWPERYTSHPHNFVLDVWLRLGIAGLVLLLGAFVFVVASIRQLRTRDDGSERRMLGVAAAALIVGGATHGLVDNGFFLPDLAVLTWIAVSLLEAAVQSPTAADEAAP